MCNTGLIGTNTFNLFVFSRASVPVFFMVLFKNTGSFEVKNIVSKFGVPMCPLRCKSIWLTAAQKIVKMRIGMSAPAGERTQRWSRK